MEIPLMLMIILWTILLCLRADDTIYINYHLVNLPMYVACAHLFVGLVLTDVWWVANANYATQVEFKVECMMTLVAEELVPIHKRRKYTLYVGFSFTCVHLVSNFIFRYFVLAMFVAFLIMLAEYLNEDGGLPESGNS
jgi:hypothetical protein